MRTRYCGAKGVAFSTRIARDATRVEIDRMQIRQVLFNLIRNAIEAMEGCAHRALTVTARAEGEDMVEISVADTGPGLPDEVLSNLFEPFAAAQTERYGDRAVDLPLDRGAWWPPVVESKPEGGTVFRFTLRCEPPDRMGQDDRSSGGTREQSAPENDSAMLEAGLLERIDNCQYGRNKEGTAVPGAPNVFDESKLIAESRAGLDVLAGPPSSERNDANDYAACWRERSGLVTPVPEADHILHRDTVDGSRPRSET